tara:strand:- start:39 stop:245 length:207 start_codon:yes stop_codon:yes gene_type:complete
MKKILKFIILIFLGIVFIYFLKTNFVEYNLEKSINACIVAQKRTSETFDMEKTKKYCEEQVRKQKEAY